MFKRIVSSIAATAILAAIGVFVPVSAEEDRLGLSVSAKSAILMEAGTGRVLYEKDADTPRAIASTTKLMTALVVLENASLTDTVTVTDECQNVEGTSMYLKAGDTLTVRELLYGLMLESGNDAATALAVHVAGSAAHFADLMNEKAAGLGLTRTHFENPHGLTAEGHASSARDLAVLMVHCMENPVFAQIASTKSIRIGGRSLQNHNKLLGRFEGMLAGKTGYTKAAGRTLVTCAERNGLRLVCVTLNDGDDWDDHAALYEAAFAAWGRQECVAAGEIAAEVPVISGVEGSVALRAARGASVLRHEGDEIETRVCTPEFVYADVRAGTALGSVQILRNGEIVDTVELVAAGDVKRDREQKLGFFGQLKRSAGW